MQQTKTRSVNFKFARISSVAKDLKVFPSRGVIKVAGGLSTKQGVMGIGSSVLSPYLSLVTGEEEVLPNVGALTLEKQEEEVMVAKEEVMVAEEEIMVDGAVCGICLPPPRHDGRCVSSFVFVDLERACGNLDSEIIQIGFCTANTEGLANIFPEGKIDPVASHMSHKIVATVNGQLKRKGRILPFGNLKTAAEEFIMFLQNFRSQNGKKAVLCCHGDDMVT